MKRLTGRQQRLTMRRVNILNLPDRTILRTIDGSHDYQMTATYDVAAVACHSCWRFGFLQRFGKRTQLFLDLPMHGKRVGIHVERQRYRCTNCRHTMLQPLPQMDDKRQMAKRLLSHIGEASLRRTFTSMPGIWMRRRCLPHQSGWVSMNSHCYGIPAAS